MSLLPRLGCNYLDQPCGVAVETPVLSWQGPAARLCIFTESGALCFDSQTSVDSPFRPAWVPASQQIYRWTASATSA